jgi:hypothetical protein
LNHADFFTIDFPRNALEGAACVKVQTFSAPNKNQKPGAPAYAEKHRQTTISEGKAAYFQRGIKSECDLVAFDAKNIAFLGIRARKIRDDLPTLPDLSLAREQRHRVIQMPRRFLAERHFGSVPASLMTWPWITDPGIRRLCACSRMPTVRKCNGWDQNLFTLTQDAVQFKVSGLPTSRVNLNIYKEDCFAGVA